MYRIIGADGKEYGPITAEQVRQWAAEGRANTQTKIRLEGSIEWKTLADFPELIGVPPAAPAGVPPAFPPSGAVVVGQAVLDQVNGPSIGLIITGALSVFFAILRAVLVLSGVGLNLLQANSNTAMPSWFSAMSGTAGVLMAVLQTACGIIVLLGGIKMRKLENYGLCMTASIIAMIPCISICCLIGLPIGIWALVILSKPEVKSSFH